MIEDACVIRVSVLGMRMCVSSRCIFCCGCDGECQRFQFFIFPVVFFLESVMMYQYQDTQVDGIEYLSCMPRWEVMADCIYFYVHVL